MAVVSVGAGEAAAAAAAPRGPDGRVVPGLWVREDEAAATAALDAALYGNSSGSGNGGKTNGDRDRDEEDDNEAGAGAEAEAEGWDGNVAAALWGFTDSSSSDDGDDDGDHADDSDGGDAGNGKDGHGSAADKKGRKRHWQQASSSQLRQQQQPGKPGKQPRRHPRRHPLWWLLHAPDSAGGAACLPLIPRELSLRDVAAAAAKLALTPTPAPAVAPLLAAAHFGGSGADNAQAAAGSHTSPSTNSGSIPAGSGFSAVSGSGAGSGPGPGRTTAPPLIPSLHLPARLSAAFAPHTATAHTVALLVPYYTELLLRYGPDERVLWYRANAHRAAGALLACCKDLDRMHDLNPRFLAEYLAKPCPLDALDGKKLCWVQWRLFEPLHQIAPTNMPCVQTGLLLALPPPGPEAAAGLAALGSGAGSDGGGSGSGSTGGGSRSSAGAGSSASASGGASVAMAGLGLPSVTPTAPASLTSLPVALPMLLERLLLYYRLTSDPAAALPSEDPAHGHLCAVDLLRQLAAAPASAAAPSLIEALMSPYAQERQAQRAGLGLGGAAGFAPAAAAAAAAAATAAATAAAVSSNINNSSSGDANAHDGNGTLSGNNKTSPIGSNIGDSATPDAAAAASAAAAEAAAAAAAGSAADVSALLSSLDQGTASLTTPSALTAADVSAQVSALLTDYLALLLPRTGGAARGRLTLALLRLRGWDLPTLRHDCLEALRGMSQAAAALLTGPEAAAYADVFPFAGTANRPPGTAAAGGQRAGLAVDTAVLSVRLGDPILTRALALTGDLCLVDVPIATSALSFPPTGAAHAAAMPTSSSSAAAIGSDAAGADGSNGNGNSAGVGVDGTALPFSVPAVDDNVVAMPRQFVAWTLRHEAAAFLSLLAQGYLLQAQNDKCVLLLHRALSLEPSCALAHTVLLGFHTRFSPLAATAAQLALLLQTHPLWVPGADLHCQPLLHSPRSFLRPDGAKTLSALFLRGETNLAALPLITGSAAGTTTLALANAQLMARATGAVAAGAATGPGAAAALGLTLDAVPSFARAVRLVRSHAQPFYRRPMLILRSSNSSGSHSSSSSSSSSSSHGVIGDESKDVADRELAQSDTGNGDDYDDYDVVVFDADVSRPPPRPLPPTAVWVAAALAEPAPAALPLPSSPSPTTTAAAAATATTALSTRLGAGLRIRRRPTPAQHAAAALQSVLSGPAWRALLTQRTAVFAFLAHPIDAAATATALPGLVPVLARAIPPPPRSAATAKSAAARAMAAGASASASAANPGSYAYGVSGSRPSTAQAAARAAAAAAAGASATTTAAAAAAAAAASAPAGVSDAELLEDLGLAPAPPRSAAASAALSRPDYAYSDPQSFLLAHPARITPAARALSLNPQLQPAFQRALQRNRLARAIGAARAPGAVASAASTATGAVDGPDAGAGGLSGSEALAVALADRYFSAVHAAVADAGPRAAAATAAARAVARARRVDTSAPVAAADINANNSTAAGSENASNGSVARTRTRRAAGNDDSTPADPATARGKSQPPARSPSPGRRNRARGAGAPNNNSAVSAAALAEYTASPCAGAVASPGWSALTLYVEGARRLAAGDVRGAALAWAAALALQPQFCPVLTEALLVVEGARTGARVRDIRGPRPNSRVSSAVASAAAITAAQAASAASVRPPQHTLLMTIFAPTQAPLVVASLFARAQFYADAGGSEDAAFADLSLLTSLASLSDALWRRALLLLRRGRARAAIGDLSAAVAMVRQDKELTLPSGQRVRTQSDYHVLQMLQRKLEAYLLLRAMLRFKLLDYAAAEADAGEVIASARAFIPVAAAAATLFGGGTALGSPAAGAAAAAAASPALPAAHRLRSLCSSHLDDWESALEDLQAYLRLQPYDLGAKLRLVHMLSLTRSFTAAHNTLKQLLAAAPRSPALLFARGLTFYRQQRWQRAQACFVSCLATAPGFVEARARLAECLERQGQLRRAAAVYKQIIAAAAPDTLPGMHRALGRVLIGLAQLSYAAMSARSAAAATVAVAAAGSSGGVGGSNAAGEFGGSSSSGSSSSSTLGANARPSDRPCGDAAAEASVEAELVSGVRTHLLLAVSALKIAVVADANDAEALFLLSYATVFLSGSATAAADAAARPWLTRAVALAPAHVSARVLLAVVLTRAGDRARAAVELQGALQRDPDHPTALLLRGFLHFLDGDAARALARYTRVLELPVAVPVAPSAAAARRPQRAGGGAGVSSSSAAASAGADWADDDDDTISMPQHLAPSRTVLSAFALNGTGGSGAGGGAGSDAAALEAAADAAAADGDAGSLARDPVQLALALAAGVRAGVLAHGPAQATRVGLSQALRALAYANRGLALLTLGQHTHALVSLENAIELAAGLAPGGVGAVRSLGSAAAGGVDPAAAAISAGKLFPGAAAAITGPAAAAGALARLFRAELHRRMGLGEEVRSCQQLLNETF